MTIWIKNVERAWLSLLYIILDIDIRLPEVVKDAQENFASSSIEPLPPLPARPVSHIYSRNPASRPGRAPRKIIPANQIFAQEIEESSPRRQAITHASPNHTIATIPSEIYQASTTSTPLSNRQTPSPHAKQKPLPLSLDTGAPDGGSPGGPIQTHKLLSGQISPVHQLNYELEHGMHFLELSAVNSHAIA